MNPGLGLSAAAAFGAGRSREAKGAAKSGWGHGRAGDMVP